MNCFLYASSRTGNTRKLALALSAALKGAADLTTCLCTGAPGEAQPTVPPETQLVFAGFWVDKGNADDAAADFLRSLRGKKVFLFGTAGFGGDQAYYDRILSGVQALLDGSNQETGSFLCQGQMPDAVRARYVAALEKDPRDARAAAMLSHFDAAQGHPDSRDCAALLRAAEQVLSQEK